MDEDGNSNRDASIDYIMETIRGPLKGMKDQAIIDKTISEAPITIREATMVFTGNIYPKAELINHLAELELHPEISGAKQVGELVLQSNGSLKWEQKKYGDILGYPIDDRKNPDRSGSIVIWEHPVEETGAGLYFVAVDPYDHDTGTSLGSAIV
jgi:hypothetical protein